MRSYDQGILLSDDLQVFGWFAYSKMKDGQDFERRGTGIQVKGVVLGKHWDVEIEGKPPTILVHVATLSGKVLSRVAILKVLWKEARCS